MKVCHRLAVIPFLPASVCAADAINLVSNGSFEELDKRTGAPAHWSAAGTVKQHLTADVGRDGKRCAKLECSEFVGDGPATHAMIAQSGRVAVRRGQSYRLICWAKGERIAAGAVEVAL